MKPSAYDMERIKHINFLMDSIHDQTTEIYEHLVDRDYDDLVSSINMITYLNSGLVKSKFVNLQIRQLSAETSHDFIEWCGLVQGNPANQLLVVGEKLMKQDLYLEFISEYPDYGPC